MASFHFRITRETKQGWKNVRFDSQLHLLGQRQSANPLSVCSTKAVNLRCLSLHVTYILSSVRLSACPRPPLIGPEPSRSFLAKKHMPVLIYLIRLNTKDMKHVIIAPVFIPLVLARFHTGVSAVVIITAINIYLTDVFIILTL